MRSTVQCGLEAVSQILSRIHLAYRTSVLTVCNGIRGEIPAVIGEDVFPMLLNELCEIDCRAVNTVKSTQK